jgi:hypothetical protein
MRGERIDQRDIGCAEHRSATAIHDRQGRDDFLARVQGNDERRTKIIRPAHGTVKAMIGSRVREQHRLPLTKYRPRDRLLHRDNAFLEGFCTVAVSDNQTKRVVVVFRHRQECQVGAQEQSRLAGHLAKRRMNVAAREQRARNLAHRADEAILTLARDLGLTAYRRIAYRRKDDRNAATVDRRERDLDRNFPVARSAHHNVRPGRHRPRRRPFLDVCGTHGNVFGAKAGGNQRFDPGPDQRVARVAREVAQTLVDGDDLTVVGCDDDPIRQRVEELLEGTRRKEVADVHAHDSG